MTTNDKAMPRSWRRSVTATRTSILLTVFLYLAIPVLADNNDYRIEVFGSVGASEYIVIWGPPARGINLGGGIGVRPFSQERSWILRGLGGEFEMNVTRGISNRIVQSYYLGNLLYHLPLSSAEPYILIGIGGSHEAGLTRQAADVGLGVKVFTKSRLSLRPEIRIFGAEYLGSFLRTSVGIGYRW